MQTGSRRWSGQCERDPTLHLSYMLFAEYFVALLGPEWLKLLEERCGVARSSMTFVANHAELDRDHAEEAFDLIDELVSDPRKLAPMRQVVVETIAAFDDFCDEMVRAADEVIRERSLANAPAA